MQHAPPESAIGRVSNPDYWVTSEVRLLAEATHKLAVLAWMRTKDALSPHPQNYPERIPLTASERAAWDEAHAPEYDAMTLEEAADFLGWKRELRT